jgi:hypothetical protein
MAPSSALIHSTISVSAGKQQQQQQQQQHM